MTATSLPSTPDGASDGRSPKNEPKDSKSLTDTWLWMPHAGHFIGSYNCHFALNTKVGDYIVSTVGEYETSGKRRDWEQLGMDRTYETMVFPALAETDPEAMCCPYTIDVSEQLDMEGYNDAVSATKGHYKMCHKWQVQGIDLVATNLDDTTAAVESAQPTPSPDIREAIAKVFTDYGYIRVDIALIDQIATLFTQSLDSLLEQKREYGTEFTPGGKFHNIRRGGFEAIPVSALEQLKEQLHG